MPNIGDTRPAPPTPVVEPAFVVVDGSNLATEGRTAPSLAQLDDAVRTYAEEHPKTEIVVVVDATFAHRVDAAERAELEQAELHRELVAPPAGTVGRGDAFILRIAERAGATVLSNDSYQEFHGEHPWLFEPGRLVGGKPVPGVGWIFTERTPVRGAKSRAVAPRGRLRGGRGRRAAAANAVPAAAGHLPAAGNGAGPAGGAGPAEPVAGAAGTGQDLLTTVAAEVRDEVAAGNGSVAGDASPVPAEKSVKAGRAVAASTKKAAKAGAAKKVAKAATKTATKKTGTAAKKTTKTTAKKAAEAGAAKKATKTTAKKAAEAGAAKKAAKKAAPAKKATKAAKTAPAKQATKAAKTAPAKPAKQATKAAKTAPAKPAKQATKAAKAAAETPTPTGAPAAGAVPSAAARNEPLAFITFAAEHPPGSVVTGTVAAFTSHGALVDVQMQDGHVLRCYAPLAGLGDPPPRRAREVVERGEARLFRVVALDTGRRAADLELVSSRAR